MTAMNHYLNLTDDLICILDDKGCFQNVNGNWKNLFQGGFLPGMSFLDLVHDEHQPQIAAFFQSAQRTVVHLAECHLTDKRGRDFWLDLKIRWMPAQNRYWCLLKDITHTRYLFSMLDHISDACKLGHWSYNSATHKLHWSLKLYDIMGKDPISFEPTLEKMKELFDPADVKHFHEAYKESQEFDLTMAVNSSAQKWVRFHGIREFQPDGHFITKGIIQDVTREKLKEIIQLSSNIELSSFERGLDQFSIVARTDARGKILYANEEFCRISKYSEAELIGQDHRILNSDYHPKHFFKEMWECIQQGKNWRGEIRNKAKDGSFYWVDTTIIPIRDSQGVLKEIISFRFEITNLKKEQEQNRILRNKLELLMQSSQIGNWSYDFQSHQLKWDERACKIMGKGPHENPQIELLLSFFDQADFEKFLKDSLRQDYQVEATSNSHKIHFQVKVIRNYLGEPIRMDGICLYKGSPEKPELPLELAN